MLQPASLKSLPYYPVTAGVAAASVAATLLWWTNHNVDWFFMDERVWTRWEIWRAFTATLPHVNFFHLAFNIYWLWAFGTVVENVYGHLKFAAIILLFALGSMLAEFALLSGGVGLSGVGYGLWGLLWALDRNDPRFAGAMDNRTSKLFLAWFVICIVLTVTGVMAVANIAHGAGALMGALLGLTISARGKEKLSSAAALTALLLLIAAGTFFWPQINFSSTAEAEMERAGVDALESGELMKATRLLEVASTMRRAQARTWYNLGVAYQRRRQYQDAYAAFERAARISGGNPEYRDAARDMKAAAAWERGKP
jgi:membrane associated rhomboid family serine protease